MQYITYTVKNRRTDESYILIFNVIDKTYYQSSVSNADQEFPTLGSKDNVENSVKLVSGSICLPSGWNFLVCIDRFARL